MIYVSTRGRYPFIVDDIVHKILPYYHQLNLFKMGEDKGSFLVKAGLARMLKGGVIMDVINVEQAKIAEAAGAVAVMALERIPADIRYDGGVARMSDPEMIREIQAAVTIPVMAKVRYIAFYFIPLLLPLSQPLVKHY
jgi:hypothetical protein